MGSRVDRFATQNELKRSGSQNDWSPFRVWQTTRRWIGQQEHTRNTVVTLRRGILGAPSMPGLGDVRPPAAVL